MSIKIISYDPIFKSNDEKTGLYHVYEPETERYMLIHMPLFNSDNLIMPKILKPDILENAIKKKFKYYISKVK